MRFLVPLLCSASLAASAFAADEFVESVLHREDPSVPHGTDWQRQIAGLLS